MIRRNLQNSREIQTHSIQKIQAKIQEIRPNRRYSIAGNSIIYHHNEDKIQNIQRSPLSNNIVNSIRKPLQTNNNYSNNNNDYRNSGTNYQSSQKSNTYSYTTKLSNMQPQLKQFDSGILSSVKRQSISGYGQLRNRNRNYLSTNTNNQKQSLLLNVNYSKYSDGLPLRRQYNYQQQDNNKEKQIKVDPFQRSTTKFNANHQLNKYSSIEQQQLKQRITNRDYPQPNTHKQDQNISQLQFPSRKTSQQHIIQRPSIGANIKQDNSNSIGIDSSKLKFDYERLDKKYNYSKIQTNVKEPQFGQSCQNQQFSQIQLSSDKNIKPLFYENSEATSRHYRNQNQDQSMPKYNQFSIKQHKVDSRNKQRKSSNFTLSQSNQNKNIREQQFLDSSQHGFDNSNKICFRKSDQQTSEKTFDNLKQRLKQAIMQKPHSNAQFNRPQKQNAKIENFYFPSKQNSNQFLNTSQNLDFNMSFNNQSKSITKNKYNIDKENNSPNKITNRVQLYGSNSHQNSRISFVQQDRCLNLLDLNIPSLGKINRKINHDQFKTKVDKKQVAQNGSSNIEDNNKISTLSKLKMIGQFNDKINQRIKHIIQNFEGYQMKI